MKKLIFMGVLGLFLLGSCNSKSGHDHEGAIMERRKHIITTTKGMTIITKGMTMKKKTTTMRMKVTKGIIMKRKLLQPDIPMR